MKVKYYETVSLLNPRFRAGGGAAGCAPLQHPRTLIGLSRCRLGARDILRLIDSRKIRWAWDISRKGASRPEVRILGRSLLDYLAEENSGVAPKERAASLDKVIASILPPSVTPRVLLNPAELNRRLMCCSRHLRGLVEDGELSADRAGKLAISYASVAAFLKRRCLSV